MATIAQLKPYVSEGKRHAGYSKTVNIMHHLKFHVNGYQYYDISQQGSTQYRHHKEENPYFQILIDERRPMEKADVRDYRRKIYSSITKRPCYKVINSLKKIVKTEEWDIDFTSVKFSSRIPKDERFDLYLTENFPKYGSLEGWVYQVALKALLSDPNLVIGVMPQRLPKVDTEYMQPMPYLFASDKVFEYSDELIIVESNELSTFGDKGQWTAPVLYIFEPNLISKAYKTDISNNYRIEPYMATTKMAAFRSGFGDVTETINMSDIYDSFLSPMLPDLDRAARENSDLDSAVVQHLFPLEWYYANTDCNTCSGTGKVIVEGVQTVCTTCSGTGKMLKSPWTDLVVKPQSFGENPVPTPPAGIVQRDTDVIKVQDERIAGHLTNALAALNMEFLSERPLNQSGHAKEVDKDELNNFVYSVAYRLVENVLMPTITLIAMQRYGAVVNDVAEILPNVTIPERFDILSESSTLDQLRKAGESKIDATVMAEIQQDFVDKKFRNNKVVRDKLILQNRMQPFGTWTVQEVADAAMLGMITKADQVKHAYLDMFINRAMIEHDDFLAKTYTEQEQIIDTYVAAKVKELSGQA